MKVILSILYVCKVKKKKRYAQIFGSKKDFDKYE